MQKRYIIISHTQKEKKKIRIRNVRKKNRIFYEIKMQLGKNLMSNFFLFFSLTSLCRENLPGLVRKVIFKSNAEKRLLK